MFKKLVIFRNNGPYSPASRHMRDRHERKIRDDNDLNNSLSKLTLKKRNYNNNNGGYVNNNGINENDDLDDCGSSISCESGSSCSSNGYSDESSSKLCKRRRRRRKSSTSSELELKEGEQVVTTHNNKVRLLVKSGDNSQDSSQPNENNEHSALSALKEKVQPSDEVCHWPAREYDWIELTCRMLVVKIKQLSSEKEMRQFTGQINSILDKRLNGNYHGNGSSGYSGRPLATRNMGPRKYTKMGKRNGHSNGAL